MKERGRRKRDQWTRRDRQRVEDRSSTGRFLHCGKKRRYRTQTKADEQRKRMEQMIGLKFTAYLCRYCDGWHIGRDKYYEGGLTKFVRVENKA